MKSIDWAKGVVTITRKLYKDSQECVTHSFQLDGDGLRLAFERLDYLTSADGSDWLQSMDAHMKRLEEFEDALDAPDDRIPSDERDCQRTHEAQDAP